MNFKDTIAAIATPPGEGSISVIRISGPVALSVVSKIFTTDLCLVASHTVQFGTILDKEKQAIDQVLLLVMRGPKSFTGEDVVEINCHGGVLITQEVLRRVLEVGIRMAQPGEFSYRAFLNGKIDLELEKEFM